MNKIKVSKYFLHPTLFVIFFVAGATILITAGFKFLFVVVVLVAMAVLLVTFKLFRYAALAIVLSLGSIYALFFSYFTTSNPPSNQCFKGRVSSQVNQYSQGKYRFSLTDRTSRIVIESNQADEIGYGDNLEVCITLDNIKKLDQGREKYYLSNYLSQNVIVNPEIKYLKRGKGIRRTLFDFSDYLGKKFYYLWPGDKGVLARGLILGGSQDFSDEVGGALKNSGTSHLTAVSGYNVAIITVILFNFLRFRSKKLAIGLTSVILLSFVFLTGLTPSVLRAALMGGAYLLAKILGRPKMTLHFLMLAGLILVLSNPFMLYNVGFLLSFAATYGLILAGNLTTGILKQKQGAIKVLLTTLGETVIAQIFVMPILLYYFGKISTVAPISNILILPIIPLAMVLEFVAIIVSFINFHLSILFAKLIEPVLSYILFIIKLFGTNTWAVIQVESIGILAVIGFYLMLHAGLFFAGRYLKRDFAKMKTR